MSQLISEWKAKKAAEATAEAEALHDRLSQAIAVKRVQLYTDQRMLDFQGSPVHNGWDHLMPLMVMMVLALVILLSTGVPFGIVAMTLGALIHLLGIKHFVAWRIRTRTLAYMLQSVHHWHQIWQLGGVAIYMPEANEPPCLAPRGDWRKFVQRNLSEFTGVPVPTTQPAAEEIAVQDGEVLPP